MVVRDTLTASLRNQVVPSTTFVGIPQMAGGILCSSGIWESGNFFATVILNASALVNWPASCFGAAREEKENRGSDICTQRDHLFHGI
jgi:hypothetical protein